MYLRLEERIKRATIRKKAKWASEWAHGQQKEGLSDGRFTFSKIFHYVTKRKYAPVSTKLEKHALMQGSETSSFYNYCRGRTSQST